MLANAFRKQVQHYIEEAIGLCRMERWDEARECFIQAEACSEAKDVKNIRNDISICCMNLGLEQEQHGHLNEALRSYAQALEINPHYGKACYARARLLVRTRSTVNPNDWPARLAEAMALLKKAAVIWPAYRTMALDDVYFVTVRREPQFALALRMLVA